MLVALIEWAASRADRRRDEIPLMPAPAPPAPAPADAAWFVPPVEHTLLEAPAESPTAITKLPPPQEHDAAAERSPGRLTHRAARLLEPAKPFAADP